ncbi:hypothetical protein pb186bvf_019613 [Paramecium bursaria]
MQNLKTNIKADQYLNHYQALFNKFWNLALEMRQNKDWHSLRDLLRKDLYEFEKLPKAIKAKVDQFMRYSLQFFLNEALFHLKQEITNKEIFDFNDQSDLKINQIKAKTFFMLFKQTDKPEFIQQAYDTARVIPGYEKITLIYEQQLSERLKKEQFKKIQEIPDFDAFKNQIEGKYYSMHTKTNKSNKLNAQTFHFEEIEKLTTQQSTFEPSRRIKTSSSTSKTPKINLYLTSSLHFHRSILRETPKIDNYFNQKVSITEKNEDDDDKLFQMLLKRPQIKVAQKKVIKSQSQKVIQNKSDMKQSEIKVPIKHGYHLSKKSGGGMRQSVLNQRATSRLAVKDVSATKINTDKSIQVEFSQDQSNIMLQESLLEKEIKDDDRQMSYNSFSDDHHFFHIDYRKIEVILKEISEAQRKQAAKYILKYLKVYMVHKKQQKNQEKPKQVFSQFMAEIGATNVLHEEKIYRIKLILQMCQQLDNLKYKKWHVISQIKQLGSHQWKVSDIKWAVYRRITSKKERKAQPYHQDIIKLYKENINYADLIDIYSRNIDGTNAIFILSILLEINGRLFDLRMYMKNLSHLVRDMDFSQDILLKLIQFYFQQSHKNFNNQYPLQCYTTGSKQNAKDFQSIYQVSQHIIQLLNENFYIKKTMNGIKLRKIIDSEILIQNKRDGYEIIRKRKDQFRRMYVKQTIFYYIINKKQLMHRQKLIQKSQSIIQEEKVTTPKKNRQIKNFFSGLRSQTFNQSDDKNQSDSQLSGSERRTSKKNRRSLLSPDYFEQIKHLENIVDDKPFPNLFQDQELLLTYLKYVDDYLLICTLHFSFNLEHPKQVGYFIENCYDYYSQNKVKSTQIIFDEFIQKYELNRNAVQNSLYYYRNINHQAKLEILSKQPQREHYKAQRKEIIRSEYIEKKRINRLLVSQEQNEISMDHYFIFTLKIQSKQSIYFRIRNFQNQWYLYVYQMKQPLYIKIEKQHQLNKLKKMFQIVISDQNKQKHLTYQILKYLVLNYVKEIQTSVGYRHFLGFQRDIKQQFNYNLIRTDPQGIYQFILLNLVQCKSDTIKNVLRSFCTFSQFSVFSKVKNTSNKNYILFTEIKIYDFEIVQIQIYPYNSRTHIFKAYLNQDDLKMLNLQNLSLEEKAEQLKNHLSVNMNNQQRQIHLTYENNMLYVSKLNDALYKSQLVKPLFEKQKKIIYHIYKRIKKIKNQFIVFTIQINILDWSINILMYIPSLCKQFKAIMLFDDIKRLNTNTLDQFIPNTSLDYFFSDENQKFNDFIEDKIKKMDKNSLLSVEVDSVINSPRYRKAQTKAKTILYKSSFPQRVSYDFRLFKENYQSQKKINKIDVEYDIQKLIQYLKISIQNGIKKPSNPQLYFWDQLIEMANIHLNSANKYILQIDTFRGIIRQLIFSQRVFIDGEYQAEVFFEQSQVEYGSMFEKYSFVSLKESQQAQIYFAYRNLLDYSHIINLKCQFRQCIYNFSKNSSTQVSYSQAIRILHSTSRYIEEQLKLRKQIINFPQVENKSILSMKSNKKNMNVKFRINDHTKYKFIYQQRLMATIIVTIFYKNKQFYFFMEDSHTQSQKMIKMKIKAVQENIPHITILLENDINQSFQKSPYIRSL